MTTFEKRQLLTEGRLLQRYACGNGAPRFALRRYLRLLPPDQAPLGISQWLLRCSFLVACLEPLPFLPSSAYAREFKRRLFLTLLVTEVTPWGAAQSGGAAARSLPSFVLAACVIAVVEALALPLRVVAHMILWLPKSQHSL